MKLADIIQILAKEFGTSDTKEIIKHLKSDSAPKFRITGSSLGHFGFTGQIKSVSEEGIKAYMANKVSLIRLEDVETFEKAKPRVERPVRPAKTTEEAVAKPSTKKFKEVDSTDDDFTYEDEEFRPKKLKKTPSSSKGKSGSRFIPTGKK